MTTPAYSPQETAWQLIVAAVLDDDPRDHTSGSGPHELDQLLAGVPDELVALVCCTAGMGAQLVQALAAAYDVPAARLVQQFGAGMIGED